MKYTVEMGSVAMIYTPTSIKIGSGNQKLIRRIHRHTDRAEIAQAYFHFSKLGKKG
jgi:hypothetical protein